MKIAYVTVRIPFGDQEAFIIPEIRELLHQGESVEIFPIRPNTVICHEDARELVRYTHTFSMLSPKSLLDAVCVLRKKPVAGLGIVSRVLRESRSYKMKLTNLTAAIKAIVAARTFADLGIEHIHAHWGTRTATFALIVSELTGIPWSMTLHRWDIYEDNVLKLKAEKSAFIRCISEKGREDLLGIIGTEYAEKVTVIHLGVDLSVSTTVDWLPRTRIGCQIAVPANLYEVKGHHYLIDAIDILVKDGHRDLRCIFYGDGYLHDKLQNEIEKRGLADHILIYGRIDHQKLLEMYMMHEVDLVVLPSILTNSGEHEGIPVALIEAMAHSIPVVSTDTGSIPELIGDGAGAMVKSRDGVSLAHAIHRLIDDKEYYCKLADKGREKVETSYNQSFNVARICALFKLYRKSIGSEIKRENT